MVAFHCCNSLPALRVSYGKVLQVRRTVLCFVERTLGATRKINLAAGHYHWILYSAYLNCSETTAEISSPCLYFLIIVD